MSIKKTFIPVVFSTALLVACGSDDNNNPPQPSPDAAWSAVTLTTLYNDGGSSDIEIINLDEEILTATANYSPSTITDFSLAAEGQYYYKIGRFNLDTVSKYDITDPINPVFADYSTKDNNDDDTSNPYNLVFVNETKAYLLRYADAKIWIVNPSAAQEEDFKIGEIDLSAYADIDGSPEASQGVIIGDKLFVILQRLEYYVPNNTAYAAVIDTNTDEEIDLNIDTNLKGIPLQGRNPLSIRYHEAAGLFVQSVGDYGDSYSANPRPIGYSGGIEKIDLETYTTRLIVDDGDADNHPYGQISGLALINENTAYFVGYAGWGDTTLYRFNPTTGEVSRTAEENNLAGIDIRFLETGPENRLWVGIADIAQPYITLLDPQADSILAQIETSQNPTDLVFVKAP